MTSENAEAFDSACWMVNYISEWFQN